MIQPGEFNRDNSDHDNTQVPSSNGNKTLLEEFEDIKEVSECDIEEEHNGQNKKDKRTKHTHKTKIE